MNLVKLMAGEFNCSPFAIQCMVMKGQVYIDGHVMQWRWMDHWTEDQLQGRMVKCPAGARRICGARLQSDYEQMELTNG